MTFLISKMKGRRNPYAKLAANVRQSRLRTALKVINRRHGKSFKALAE